MNVDKLSAIIKYAASHVPYYKKLFSKLGLNPFSGNLDEYFNSIPILSKDTVLVNTDAFLSDEFNRNELDVDRTSGSTGKILDLYWERGDKVRSLLSLWTERKILYGIYPNSKCCYFHSIAYRTVSDLSKKEVFSPRMMIRDGGLILSLSKLNFDERTLEMYYTKIMDFNPEWIMCHPSTLYLFSNFMNRTNKKPFPKLRFIELTGEYLIESYREKIHNYFQVPIANHYGAKEVNGIAYECKNGHLHCLENNVYVEIIDGEKNIGYDKKGYVCITGLNNRCMPFIRYNLGDIAIMREGKTCGCGNNKPYLEICAGRGNEIIEINQTKRIECVVFFYIVEWINALTKNTITQFQILRTDDNNFTVIFALLNYDAEAMENIKKSFIEKSLEYGFEGVRWKFSFVDIIPPQKDTDKLNFYYDIRNK